MKHYIVCSILVAVALAKCSPDGSEASIGSSSSSDGATQSLYGQCGGDNWTGPTACADGAICNAWNPYYHQCIVGQSTLASSVIASTASGEVTAPAPSSSANVANSFSATVVEPSSAATAQPSIPSQASAFASLSSPAVSSKASAPSRPSSPAPASSVVAASPVAPSLAASSAAGSSGTVYKASFTQYGSTDTWGSGTCNTNTAACGFYSNPGYNAAVSENFFGVGPGAGAGPGCGTCWVLSPSTDSSGNILGGASSIVIKVNNLCPAQSNPLCSQSGTTGTNQYGANVNFDLCIDDGANTALFGSSNVGLAVGTATQVDCSQWSGTDIKKRMTI